MSGGYVQISTKKSEDLDFTMDFDYTKCLLSSDALHKYILETSVYPREHEELRSLRDVSTQHQFGFMTTPPEEGQLLSL
ncbi:Tricin synthase 2 [Acorus calamus]|uniref:Tricin synthase 2 n=1 Tax=Acorus calamus TaxID=4465 RepID=A0AAV9E1N0_ACOCL|nr:Tricin synthase 2 [Acorus calamus]